MAKCADPDQTSLKSVLHLLAEPYSTTVLILE